MIAPETIALVRERTDIVAVIRESVPSLKKRGRSFVGLCPFHQEKTPSFHVNADKGFFHCFGCKESGSAIDFLMKEQGLTFPEAVRSLAERAGIEIQEDRRERTEVDLQKKRKEELYSVTQLAAVFFEKMLREHPQRKYALDELARRGVAPSEYVARGEQESFHETEEGTTFQDIDDALQAFRIGYAPPQWDGLANFLRAQGVSPQAAETVGLLAPRSNSSGHYDRFRHRLMFAVLDTHGRVIAFSGRALEAIPGDDVTNPSRKQGDGEQKIAKYINSPESPIYTKGDHLFGLFQARHAIREEDTAILVEGNFDVFTLHARGLKNVVAPLGTAFTIEQAKLLKRFASHVVVMFDADGAGRKATRLARGPLREAGLAAKVANLPEGSDPDDYARTKGVGELEGLVKRARGMLEHQIDQALDPSFGSADVYERAARVAEVSKLLAEEDDPLRRMMAKTYADELAARIDLKTADRQGRHVAEESFRALEQAVKTALTKAGPVTPKLRAGETSARPQQARIEGKTPGKVHRAQIIGALVEYPELIDDADVETVFSFLEGDSARTLAVLVDSWRQARTAAELDEPVRLDPTQLLERLAQIAPAIQTFAAERLSAPKHETLASAKEELMRAAEKLKALFLDEDARAAASEQRRGDADFEQELALAGELNERMRLERHGLGPDGHPRRRASALNDGTSSAKIEPKKH